ncbi:hypothetical protein [Burkholderia ambifaria]|uniref:Uncharacterized protein n=1 Tax=Burkholderia ambifaria MEX-5 TaxID=396597 RepID=B1T2Q5_9BURK|nr:hypothetical protein [Burkholderia ambifaria]EDT42134.1 hypothetical protein BamMEX5DRAFT_2071 [Burkholderia ambifaria MEX-5]
MRDRTGGRKIAAGQRGYDALPTRGERVGQPKCREAELIGPIRFTVQVDRYPADLVGAEFPPLLERSSDGLG